MDNHRRIWHRFVSRLRGSRQTHRYIPGLVGGSQNASSSLAVADTILPGQYFNNFRDDVRMWPQLPIISSTNWNFANSFARLGHFDKLIEFTPKCLAGFNAQSVLSGQTTYDDFSHNCWLENHLHRFGGLSSDALNTDRGNTVHNEDSDVQTSSDNDSTNSFSVNTVFPPSQRVQSRGFTGNSNSYSSSNSSFISSNSSLSHVTHFYLAGFGLYPDSVFPDPPPPYTELNYDPPPPYTETEDSSVVTPPASTIRNASYQGMDNQDILW